MVKINYGKIHVALPAMDELDYLPKTLESISGQNFDNYIVHVCVNQPDSWWDDEKKIAICKNNAQTLEYIKSHVASNVKIYDRSGEGRGWIGKQSGIGWARKYLMDQIVKKADPEDIIVSADADTTYDPGYLADIYKAFATNDQVIALAPPYYHPLSGDVEIDRAMLRYEIYMRYYLINLYRIRSPYAFTALGSAMAVPVWVYKVVSGLSPKPGGEDFYFLQKLRKYGFVLNWIPSKAYPASRASSRVDFGTGPAIIKGLKNDWNSYPIFSMEDFNEIRETYNMIPRIFKRDIDTPVTYFLQQQLKEDDLWAPLRKNFKSPDAFTRAFHEKFDALRILQYLKEKNAASTQTDEEKFKEFLKTFLSQKDYEKYASILQGLSFRYSGVYELNNLRDLLCNIENRYRKNDKIG